eukprot:4759513-Pyramimonas_sp.AAC.1
MQQGRRQNSGNDGDDGSMGERRGGEERGEGRGEGQDEHQSGHQNDDDHNVMTPMVMMMLMARWCDDYDEHDDGYDER